MSIHKKLLIVLLIVALPPLLIIGLFDHQMAVRMTETLSALRQDTLAEQTVKRLRLLVDVSGAVLDRERRLAEVSLAAQAWELETRLKEAAPEKPRRDARKKPAPPTEETPPLPPATLLRLLASPLETTPGAAGDSFDSRQVLLATGVRIDLSTGRASGGKRRPGRRWKEWFDSSMAQDGPLWTIIPDSGDGESGALVVSMPLHAQDGTAVALTTVRLSAKFLLQSVPLPAETPAGASLMLVDPVRGETASLLAVTPPPAATPAALPRLEAIAKAFIIAASGAASSAESGIGQMDVDGKPMLLIFGPAGRLGPRLVLAVEKDSLVSGMTAQERSARRRVDQQLMAAAVALALLLLIGVALSFIAARSITQPIEELAEVAGRLAEGDMEARADIHTGDEMEELGAAFNAMLPKLQDRVRMRDALSLAMEVQQKLLPASAPHVPGLDLGGLSLYCDETGGDYYDFIEISELSSQRIGIAVGDVAGHGIAAALLMATARALLRSRASQAGSLSQVMTEINSHIADDAHAGRFMTLFYGVIDATRRSLRWVSAGHAPAILYHQATDTFSELAGHDIPLGIEPGWVFREDRRDGWMPGELIAIGTDGIWETRDPSGAMFGMDALHGIIRANAHRSASDICNAVAASLREFRHGRPQDDDITLVIVKFV
ncbi:MAG: SpoIIE family protein phosphatase [Alphaproteobacteria bacterium]|nr:SpoIIE family protein phosphatase [Alphaproteobacteria bacterium]